jgi:hypothetical protein
MTAAEQLEAVAGRTLPGGCETCAAEQTVVRHPVLRNVFVLQIEHDDDCPTLRAAQRRPR